MKNYILGIDVGGTNVKTGLLNAEGQVVARGHLSTKDFARNKKQLIKAMVDGVRSLLAQQKISTRQLKGIGMGLPGLIDFERGNVIFLPNIPGWRNVPLKSLFEEQLQVPTFIENDVNLITLGEWKFGAGRDYQNLVCLTLGTGVGSGLVLGGKIYRGEGFVAGELGHMPLNEEGPACNCGGHGCFERYVGNRTLQARAAEVFGQADIQLEEVSRLAASGDKTALAFWDETAVKIGNGLVGIVNLLNPRCLVIGGGVANSHRFLFKTITKTIRSRAMQVQGKMFKVVKAQLGNDAGIVGAQVLVQEGLSGSLKQRR